MNVVKSTLGVMLLASVVALLANPAHARGSVVIDVPGVSIGYYDDHYGRSHYRGKRYKKRHKHRGRCDLRSNRKHDYRYDNYRRGGGHYDYRERNYYSSPYRNGYRQPNTVCPNPGYSRYRIDRAYCTRHKDHYHCE